MLVKIFSHYMLTGGGGGAFCGTDQGRWKVLRVGAGHE